MSQIFSFVSVSELNHIKLKTHQQKITSMFLIQLVICVYILLFMSLNEMA